VKTPKRIWAREVARKEADYWQGTNEIRRERGEPEFTLEWMLAGMWLKGFEAGRRDAAQKKKEGGGK
jgi:hypothetical protein